MIHITNKSEQGQKSTSPKTTFTMTIDSNDLLLSASYDAHAFDVAIF